MKLAEGDLVVVLGAINLKTFVRDESSLVIGTYIGSVNKDQAQVLLPDGFILTCNPRDICLKSDQS